jgi:predicted type IV restriction endonuclease
VTTTPDELDGFYVVRAILREVVSVKRVVMRDVQSYCGILLDDNNRKPICRLHFNATQKNVTFFDDQKETRVPIAQIDDL